MRSQSLLLLLIATVSLAEKIPEVKRQLFTSINPGCGIKCEQARNISSDNLIYTKATGNTDTIHYIWSTIGAPTTIIAQTSNTTQLKIEWDRLLNRSISVVEAVTFTETPYYSFGVVISKIIEFDDVNDTASIEGISDIFIHRVSSEIINWERVSLDVNSTDHVRASITTLNGTSEWLEGDGKIVLQFDVHGNDDHDDVLPRLQFNSNSSLIRITMDKVNPVYNHSRFGFEIVAIGSEDFGKYEESSTDTINDEFTPGVFRAIQLVSPGHGGFGSYFHWKPVAYTSTDFTVIESSDVKFYPDKTILSTLDMQFRNITTHFVVTVGTKLDGFYQKKNYFSWSFVSGIGEPPMEKFSLLVIMVIASGLGLPVILMISSTVYIFVHKHKQNKLLTGQLNFN